MTYQIPQKIQINPHGAGQGEVPAEEAVKLISGTLNKLTPQNNERLLSVVLNKLGLQTMSLDTLYVVAEAFHTKIIKQKTLAKLYCNFFLSLSFSSLNNRLLIDILSKLIWKQIDNQYTNHANVEQLCGNYVFLIELFVQLQQQQPPQQLFDYARLDLILTDLITYNQEWSWNIIHTVLIFHGVSLRKLYTQSIETYLASIDAAIAANDIQPTRLKYLLMDIKQHIRKGENIRNRKNRKNKKGKVFINPQTLTHTPSFYFIKKDKNVNKKRKKKKRKHRQRFSPNPGQYPWHNYAPPRFEPIYNTQPVQQQRFAEKLTNMIKIQGQGPLYLRNPNIPPPPNKLPPPPPPPTYTAFADEKKEECVGEYKYLHTSTAIDNDEKREEDKYFVPAPPTQTIEVIEKELFPLIENDEKEDEKEEHKENSESFFDFNGIVPAFWFGTANKREKLEELNLETALACQYFDFEEDNDIDDDEKYEGNLHIDMDDYKEMVDSEQGSDGSDSFLFSPANKANETGNLEEFEIALLFLYIVIIHFVVLIPFT